MVWTIIAILIALWLAGVIFSIAEGLIHILLVIALAVLIFKFLTGRRRT